MRGSGVPAPEVLPVSLVAHHIFCPRRAWLEAAGEETDTFQMAAGTAAHRAVDDPTSSRTRRTVALDISHRGLAITGRCDAVESTNSQHLTVVEYKATPVKKRPEVTDAMRVQLALQSICLTDMGHDVVGHEVFFTTHHQRVQVELAAEDFVLAVEAVHATRVVIESATAPAPLEDDARCTRCSHVGVCLPEERAETTVTRRIKVADPDAQMVHLASPGSRASIARGRMVVTWRGEQIASVPIERIQGLVAHGNIDLSGALIREILWRGLTIVWCTGTGRVVGWSQPARSANGLQRVRQHEAAAQGRLVLAREFVAAKIANQATLLRRNGDSAPAIARMRTLQRRAARIDTTGELFGVEGEAAALYFTGFPTMLRGSQAEGFAGQWPGRSGRTALDPLNTALNYVYGILLSETIRSLAACGLDPHAGFLHSSARNKPALALDLMEEFRAPIADSVVTGAINNGEISLREFSSTLGSCRLNDRGRKVLIAAYERRVQTEFLHPVFGYRITWRRALEVQARMVLGYLDGSQSTYVGIKTR